MQNGLTDFLLELLIRLFSDTPWFFRVLRIIGSTVAVITGLPLLLANAGIDLPDAIDAISSQVVSIAAIVGTIVSQLTVTSAGKVKEHLKD
jgi:hypothetical protein